LTSGEDSHFRERKKIERNTRSKEKRENTQRERENTKREREANEKRKKKLSSLFVFALCSSVSLSSLLFFFLALLSLSRSLSLSSGGVCLCFPLSRNSDESARGFQRAPLCCSETRALQREKRERERERKRRERERARASEHSLFRRKFLSFALSLRHYREELTTTRKTEYSFLSCAEENRKLACFPWETIIMRTKRRRKNHRRR
jgi:hypothetical protein